MKILFHVCAAACAALMPANIAVAKTTRLQTVDITDRHMSTEGGEVRLYRIADARRQHCRIEAIHLGETGKAIYVFDFGPKLFAAERRQYRYNGHIFSTPDIKETLAERTTLSSRTGRESLPRDFAEYKTFFDARHLTKCLGK